jgi:hypothetical protein
MPHPISQNEPMAIQAHQTERGPSPATWRNPRVRTKRADAANPEASPSVSFRPANSSIRWKNRRIAHAARGELLWSLSCVKETFHNPVSNQPVDPPPGPKIFPGGSRSCMAGVGGGMSSPDSFRPRLPRAPGIPFAGRVCVRSVLFSTLLLATLLSGVDRSTPPHPPPALGVDSDTDSLAQVLHPPSPVLLSVGFGEVGAWGPQLAPHRVQRDPLLLEGAQVVDAPGARPWEAHPGGHPSPYLQPRPPPVSLRMA